MTLIAVSGVDGSGKSTQIKLLADALSSRGTPVTVRWFRPGYSPLAERFKRSLHLPSAGSRARGNGRAVEVERRNSAMDRPVVRLIWLVFAGVDTLVEMGLIARVISRKQTVIYDRWELDAMLDLRINFADWPRVVAAIEMAAGAIKRTPDSSVLLMVPREIALGRLAEKDEPFPDTDDVANQRRDRYDGYARSNPGLVVDGSGSPGAVHQVMSRLITAGMDA